MSDAVLERFGSATGQERVDLRRVQSEGTVSLRREDTRVPGALGMVGWLAGATMPAEYDASEHIAVSVGARVVVDAEAAAGIAAAVGQMVGHARVLPTLSLATEAGGAPATRDVADGRGPRAIQSSTTAAAQADERAAMRALASRVAAEAPAVEVELPEVPPLAWQPHRGRTSVVRVDRRAARAASRRDRTTGVPVRPRDNAGGAPRTARCSRGARIAAGWRTRAQGRKAVARCWRTDRRRAAP